jgi:uncharacterized membrane protein YsdA (DUF1294 family)
VNAPLWIIGALATATVLGGIAAAVALWIDRRRARQGRWRIPERTLHTIELCGGWLGSLIARRTLRHKSRKPSYRLVAAGIGVLHTAAWAALVVWAWRARG